MQTYIAMLRGINVSGQKKVLMADLKEIFKSLSYADVQTYIQSGNVIYKTDAHDSELQQALAIEKAIEAHYTFTVAVVVRKLESIKDTLDANPFLKQKDVAVDRLYVTFLAQQPEASLVEKLSTFKLSTDVYAVVGADIYLYCPGGYGETKLSNNFFETKLKVVATTRNWKTVQTLHSMGLG